jgi:hypothetical protein
MMIRRPASTAIWAPTWIPAAIAALDGIPPWRIGNSEANTLNYRPFGESSQ